MNEKYSKRLANLNMGFRVGVINLISPFESLKYLSQIFRSVAGKFENQTVGFMKNQKKYFWYNLMVNFWASI